MVTRRNAKTRDTVLEDGPQDDAPQVLRQFRQVLNAVKTHFQQVERKSGLGGAQVWALSLVRQHPGIGVGELAREMDINPSTASNLVKLLTERGMVEGRKEGVDRRAVQLYVLPGGAKALRRAPGPFSGVLPEALKAMDPTSLRRLRKDLGQLIVLLDADAEAARIPLGEM
ncbi:MarR family winged helix-turn-helix transcriptional regulator [Roseateles sp.]|uniref:MarR family winged helix-turn-helix transcriptional regulator n=1 Tax=Roseateles sp. TaxID=1971397 RepID=UPI002DFB9813|nr:MarR family winged helix-turn-helix transcriptional regulator [Roseateles sp.]